jgi:hypothetical protein
MKRPGDVVHVVECLSSKHEALSKEKINKINQCPHNRLVCIHCKDLVCDNLEMFMFFFKCEKQIDIWYIINMLRNKVEMHLKKELNKAGCGVSRL